MKSVGGIQSVHRALDILECVSQTREGMALRELASSLGLGATTIHNLAATLVARGYLSKTPNPKRYITGPALLGFAGREQTQIEDIQLEENARRLSKKLPKATVTITRFAGGEVAAVFRMSPEQPGVVQRPASQIMAPYTSASAMIYQAFGTAEERAAYRRRYPFEEYGAGVWARLRRLDVYLDEVRERGFALLEGGEIERLRIAVPVFSSANELVAALGVAIGTIPGLRGERQRKQIVAALESATAFTGWKAPGYCFTEERQ